MGVIARAKEKLSSLTAILLDFAQDIALRQIDNRYMVFHGSALSIYGFDYDDKCVYLLPDKHLPIYCVEIEGDGSIPRQFSDFAKVVESYSYEDSAEIVLFYSKSPVDVNGDENFCYKTSVYVFSPSRAILEEIANYYDTEIKDPLGIISALLDIGLAGHYYHDKEDFTVRPTLTVRNIPIDEMGYVFRTVFANGVYKAVTKDPDRCRQFRVYQSVGFRSRFTSSKPNLIDALKEKWRGYIAFSMIFTRTKVQQRIHRWQSDVQAFEFDRSIRMAYRRLKNEDFPSDPSKFAIGNVVAVLDDPSVIHRVGDALNMSFFERSIGAKDILYKTPIVSRDGNLDFLAYPSDMQRFVSSAGRRHNMPSDGGRDLWGRDIASNYISYSFRESGSPHWSIIAKTRSGKTFFVLKMISESLGTVIEPNPYYFDTSKMPFDEDSKDEEQSSRVIVTDAPKLGEKVRVVHFDTGYSGKRYVSELKKCRPDDVLFFEDDLNALRFGLTDIRYDPERKRVSEEDTMFMLSIVSLILSLSGEKELTASESTAIHDALQALFAEQKYSGLSLREMRLLGGYDEILEKIRKIRPEADEFQTIRQLDLPDEFDFLKKPLIREVATYLETKSKNNMLDEEQRAVAHSAYLKLRVVADNDIFGYYSKSNLKDSAYFYMELETISKMEKKIFIPIFVLIFFRLYRRDTLRAQKYKEADRIPPKVFYIIEEAHNFFRIDQLVDVFEKIVREAARYNIYLGLITQNAEDIPSRILNNIGTRIIMPSRDHRTQVPQLKHYWASGEDDDTIMQANINFFKKYARRFVAFMLTGSGLLTIQPKITPEEEWIFNSNPTGGQSKSGDEWSEDIEEEEEQKPSKGKAEKKDEKSGGEASEHKTEG